MSSKLFRSYAAWIGTDFLMETLRPCVKDLCKNATSGGASFEMDPSKISDSESLDKNRQKVTLNIVKLVY